MQYTGRTSGDDTIERQREVHVGDDVQAGTAGEALEELVVDRSPEHVGADDDLVLGGDPGERLLDLVRDVVMTVDERREDRHALAGAEDELEALEQALGEVRVAGDDEMLHSCAS